MQTRRISRTIGLACLLCVASAFSQVGDPISAPRAPSTQENPNPQISGGLHVGVGTAEFEAEDSMVIAGGIAPGKANGQEGKLRAVAVVLEKKPYGKLAIVACDILMITRQYLDPV